MGTKRVNKYANLRVLYKRKGLGGALDRFLHRMLPALNRLALRASATGTAADDALGLPELVAAVLAAIDDDDYDAVCKTAGSWCRALEASGPSCRDAHDTWRALAARVFTGAPTLDRDNAQANFYALCRRANEYRRYWPWRWLAKGL